MNTIRFKYYKALRLFFFYFQNKKHAESFKIKSYLIGRFKIHSQYENDLESI